MQSPVNNNITNDSLLSFFRSRLSGMTPESEMRYRKSISELDLFLTSRNLPIAEISPTTMADWATGLLCRGLSKSTVIRHLNCLNALLKAACKEGLIQENNAPRAIAIALSETPEIPPLLKDALFASTLSTLRSAMKHDEKEDHNLFTDLILFSILNGAIPLEKAAALKKSEISGYDAESTRILTRNSDTRRSYIFNLHKAGLTPRQKRQTIISGVQAAFGTITDIPAFDPDEFTRSILAACAIRSGLTPSEALRYAGGSASYAIPPFCTPAPHSPKGEVRATEAVRAMLSGEMPKWYVMQMRRGVSYDELRRDIHDKIRPRPELFYPCEKILRQRGNRKIEEEKPYINGTVFFKSTPEKIMPMFSAIGDKAWCYRVTGTPGAPYAVIPRSDMERFQRAIGIFTPDTEIHPLGNLTPRPGEQVILIKAGFGNRTATVREVIKTDCGSAIIRVQLATDQGYEFRIDVDPRQIERLTR